MTKLRELLGNIGRSLEKNSISRRVECLVPKELHLELTYACNAKCVMCNLRNLEVEREIEYEDIVKMINDSDLLKKISYIVLSGGEALLKNRFNEIVAFFAAKLPKTGILVLSNFSDPGLVADQMEGIKEVVELKRISFGTSLDGVGDVHDRIRGVKGSYESLLCTLDMMKRKYPEVYVSLNFTLTPDNYDQMLPAYLVCKKLGYHISYQVLVQKKETKQFVWENFMLSVIESHIDAILSDLARMPDGNEISACELISNEGLLSLMLSLHYIGIYIRNPKRYFPNCICGEKYAMINPNGDLYFCPVNKEWIAGNIGKDKFDNLWNSPAANEIRNKFNSKACHCWLTCTNGPMLEDALNTGRDKYIEELFR